MIINVPQLTDFAYNEQVENYMGNLLSNMSGFTISNLGGGFRPEYDYILGGIQIEQKISADRSIPVEVSKDAQGEVPSGLTISTAPLVLVLSQGESTSFDVEGKRVRVGKLRLFDRKKLRAAALREGSIKSKYYVGSTLSTSALVYRLDNAFKVPHEWLGDVKFTIDSDGNNASYDMSTFKAAAGANDKVRNLIREYQERQLEKEQA